MTFETLRRIGVALLVLFVTAFGAGYVIGHEVPTTDTLEASYHHGYELGYERGKVSGYHHGRIVEHNAMRVARCAGDERLAEDYTCVRYPVSTFVRDLLRP